MIFVNSLNLYHLQLLDNAIKPDTDIYGFIIAGASFVFIIALVFSILFLLEGSRKVPESKRDKDSIKYNGNKLEFKATCNGLREAYLAKENADSYLNKLDDLRAEDTVNERLYNTLKKEYLTKQRKALSMIVDTQTELKRQINAKLDELSEVKRRFTDMETKLQARQISPSLFINRERSFTTKIRQLENAITELKMLVDATSSDDIVPTINKKKSAGMFRSQRMQSMSHKSLEAVPPPEPETPKLETTTVADRTEIEIGEESTEAEADIPVLQKISDLKILPQVVMEGSDVGITVMVFNDKDKNITYQAYLKINNKTHDSRSVVLSPGASQEITFIYTSTKPGDFSVRLEDLQGKFKVIPLQPRLI